MNGRRAHGPSANPRLTWEIFAAVAVVALGASLVAAIPSGDRVTIGLTIWGVTVGVAIAAVVLHLILTPLPNDSGMWGASSSGRGVGSSGWAMGFADGGGGGFGDGGGGGFGDGGGGC